MISKLRCLVLGDIHLGHPNTTTESIIRGLDKVFCQTAALDDIDMIVLEGDVFDRQLTFSDQNAFLIQQWIYRLLRLCKDKDILLRVLEGTPSHDWKQSQEFGLINSVSSIGADLRYVDKLSIEYIERFDINVLYIPDEWRVYCDETWVDVQALLAKEGLSQVDFCIMHGCFPHQMPKNLHKRIDMHVSERYLSIVKYLIFVGHIHHYSQYERILAAGSFDRLCHGEESPKGYIDVTVYPEGEFEATFRENTLARIYKTIDCKSLDVDTAMRRVERVISKLPKQSAIRLLANPLDPAIGLLNVLEISYPDYQWTISVTQNKNISVLDVKPELSVFKLSGINLKETLLQRIADKHPVLLETCTHLYNEIENG